MCSFASLTSILSFSLFSCDMLDLLAYFISISLVRLLMTFKVKSQHIVVLDLRTKIFLKTWRLRLFWDFCIKWNLRTAWWRRKEIIFPSRFCSIAPLCPVPTATVGISFWNKPILNEEHQMIIFSHPMSHHESLLIISVTMFYQCLCLLIMCSVNCHFL